MNNTSTPTLPTSADAQPAVMRSAKPVLLGLGALVLVGAGAAGGVLLSRPSQPATAEPVAAMTGAAPGQVQAQGQALPAPVHSPARRDGSRAGYPNGATEAPSSRNGGSSSTTPLATEPAAMAAAPVCGYCGRVEAVETVTHKGQGTGVGAVAGGVLGGIVGNQMGGGNGRTAMTVLGAVGGGFAGNEIEKRQRSTTSYHVKVRMDDGSVRTFDREQSLAVGTPVTVDGKQLHVRQDGGGSARTSQQPAQGRMLQTGSQQS